MNNTEAKSILNQENPTNSELTYIIKYCPDADLKNKAGELLATKNPTNSELTYIIKYCPDADLKNKSGELLRINLGITEVIDEKALIKEIAKSILERPNSLKMDSWHCGTSHCLAGWACVINKTAMKIESEHNTEIAGCAIIPSMAQHFFKSDAEVLEILKQINN